MNLLTDPANLAMWKTHFLNMARNKVCGKGKRVVVKRVNDEKPIVKVVSPIAQSLEMVKSEIKGRGKRSVGHSFRSSQPKRKKVSAPNKSRKSTTTPRKKLTPSKKKPPTKKTSSKRVVKTRKSK